MSEKLVRDLMPKIPEPGGPVREFRTAEPQEMDGLLRRKVLEEAFEAASAKTRDDLVDELADLLEAATALASLNGITPDEVDGRRQHKAQTRGRFARRVVLTNI